jgi:hypothetical protein
MRMPKSCWHPCLSSARCGMIQLLRIGDPLVYLHQLSNHCLQVWFAEPTDSCMYSCAVLRRASMHGEEIGKWGIDFKHCMRLFVTRTYCIIRESLGNDIYWCTKCGSNVLVLNNVSVPSVVLSPDLVTCPATPPGYTRPRTRLTNITSSARHT